MKFGMRRPSLRGSLSARTKGAFTRAIRRAIIPDYGRKGMGLLRDPDRSVRNRIYHRVTFSFWDLLKRLFGSGRG